MLTRIAGARANISIAIGSSTVRASLILIGFPDAEAVAFALSENSDAVIPWLRVQLVQCAVLTAKS